MAITLKKARNVLKTGKSKVGKHVPPSYVSRNTDDYTDLTVDRFNISPSVQMKTISFIGVVNSENPTRGTEGSQPAYKVTIKFLDILFKDVPTEAFNTPIVIKSEGTEVTKYYRKPNFNRKKVQVKCQCPDFRHRFEWELKEVGSLFNNPRHYTRKTPKWTIGAYKKWQEDPAQNPYPYPYANATKKIGYCKHVSSLASYLKRHRYVTEK